MVIRTQSDIHHHIFGVGNPTPATPFPSHLPSQAASPMEAAHVMQRMERSPAARGVPRGYISIAKSGLLCLAMVALSQATVCSSVSNIIGGFCEPPGTFRPAGCSYGCSNVVSSPLRLWYPGNGESFVGSPAGFDLWDGSWAHVTAWRVNSHISCGIHDETPGGSSRRSPLRSLSSLGWTTGITPMLMVSPVSPSWQSRPSRWSGPTSARWR